MGQRRELAELQVLVARDVVVSADRREHLGLLHRVDAEVRFEVEVERQHVGWIVGLFRDNPYNLLFDVVCRNRCRLGCARYRLRRWRRFHLLRFRCWSNRSFRGSSRYRCRPGGDLRRWPLVADAEPPGYNLEVCARVTADFGQPRLPLSRVANAVLESELIRVAPAAVGRRHPARQRHRELRTESGPQP